MVAIVFGTPSEDLRPRWKCDVTRRIRTANSDLGGYGFAATATRLRLRGDGNGCGHGRAWHDAASKTAQATAGAIMS